MKRPQTQYCESCKHAHFLDDLDLTCDLGHKPRFYKPKPLTNLDSDWGWKRRCSDFDEALRIQFIPPAPFLFLDPS